MPRDAEKVRRRLQEAALKLFETRGYDETTAADIAAEAGVTQRTFFRHFPDKREVLFSGEDEFIEALQSAVMNVPQGLGPLEALFHAFPSVEPLFVKNRPFTAPRQRIIAGHPALQERAQTKTRAVMSALESAFRQRGVPDRAAGLAAQVGMAAIGHAVGEWFESGSTDLGAYVEQAFKELRDLSTFAAAP
ncbi:TetR/AcrR family transcriptional regulator [Paraburkholderia megapolitana]|uniref:Transcriptional regulator, TetR family n=1 Tax=Paraburkholderia megapolitana TaxID=420953 RepID=A0A1I3PUD4_9BURK|nr:TetR/AcrR family transcriptional regulator [Paraburkholderia megapolitana]SFJ24546.1 transcriptional regulator, TetR family [Paraburkholderia megapolitana]